MLKKILIVLAVLVILFVGFVAIQPSEYRVVRTADIGAPPPAVFALVNDFHKWETWSPWAKLDPAAKNTFEGPSAAFMAKAVCLFMNMDKTVGGDFERGLAQIKALAESSAKP